MSEKSGIQWTDGTWNCVTGCTKVSQGCKNCYAEKLSLRLQRMHPQGKYRNAFKLTLHEDALNIPLKWKTPRKVFVNSMSDLFHKDVPFEFINKVWDVMEKCPQHTFQILTKRPERMLEFIHTPDRRILQNVWLGTSVENANATYRINILNSITARIRFVSFEPLIGDVGELNLDNIHWAIVGGESGKGFRPMEEDWALNILRQCNEQNVAFFFKQIGGITPKSGGRLLGGKEYNEYPAKVFEEKTMGKIYDQGFLWKWFPYIKEDKNEIF